MHGSVLLFSLLSGCDAFLLEPCPGTSVFSEVSTGYTHVCALDAAGEASCSPSSAADPAPAGPFTQITSGYDFSCALDAD